MQVARDPRFIPPGKFSDEQRGRLVSYFSPAAYRDEVQTRTVDAMERVADNTDKLVDYLKPKDFAPPAATLPATTVR
jgi:hypothetical protein